MNSSSTKYGHTGFTLLSFDNAQDKRGLPRAGSRGFTLLELLIVIAIIAILSAILIFVLNPAETLRKGRDSQRISDLSTINRALALYITTTSNPDLDWDGTRGICGTNVFLARGNTTAITDTAIGGKTLKTSAPTGDSNSSVIDGTGWIPVNLASLTSGSPISRFPLDPSYLAANAASIINDDRLYLYACDTDTTHEINANLESGQFSQGGSDDRESTDGGNSNAIFEMGTKLTILADWGAGGGGGGISFDSASSASAGSSLSLVWPHTVSGNNRFLIVGISLDPNAGQTVTSVTYAGQVLTFLGARQQVSNVRAEFWYRVAPTTGTNSIAVALSPSSDVIGGATSWTGVNQGIPLGVMASAASISTSPSINVSSGNGEVVVDVLSNTQITGTLPTVGPGQTVHWNILLGPSSGGSSESGAPTVTMSWSLATSQAWAILGVSIKPL